MNDGYLSKDRTHINKSQRQRRARMRRIDYMPSPAALAVIEAKRGQRYPLNINSGVLNAIVTEWAELTGIKYQRIERPMSPAKRPELFDTFARANEFGATANKAEQSKRRVICGAKTQAGHPCRAKSVPGKRRCKWHGGCSTGPRSAEGKARARENLRQFAGSDALRTKIAVDTDEA